MEITSDYKVTSSVSGYPILTKNGVYLNDKIDPIKENIKIFESVPKSNEHIYIICGMELGHLLNFFNDNCKGFIILFEKDFELLKFTLSNVDLIKILGNPRVSLVTNFE